MGDFPKPRAAYLAPIAVLLVGVAYVLGVGPAAGVINSPWCPEWLDWALSTAYGPLEIALQFAPEEVQVAVYEYLEWWVP